MTMTSKPNYCGVYIITNMINGKQYVGQSIQLEHRARKHLIGKKQIIHKAIKKYGKQNFNWTFFETPIHLMNLYESLVIKSLNTIIPNGYNCNYGGSGIIGYNHTQEAKQKIAATRKGMKFKISTCPYCNKQGGNSLMTRYHFNNCKTKSENFHFSYK